MTQFETEGIPDYADDSTPENREYPEPQEQSLPGDEPLAVTDFGTTDAEQAEGESLDRRLSREEPDVQPVDAAEPRDEDEPDDDTSDVEGATVAQDEFDVPVGQIVEEDEGARTDTEKDAVARDLGTGPGGLGPEDQAMHVEE